MAAGIDWSEVQALARAAEQAGGVMGVAAIAPQGERVGCNGDRVFRAASTVKIPLMIEIHRQIDRGERSLTDTRSISATDRTPGSGVLLHLHEGLQLTLADLLYLVISISDNLATNILIDMAGMEAVNATMRSLGMANSVLGRRMTGVPAAAGMPANWATPSDYARVVESLLQHEAATAASCEAMLALLATQQNHRRIARCCPSATTSAGVPRRAASKASPTMQDMSPAAARR